MVFCIKHDTKYRIEFFLNCNRFIFVFDLAPSLKLNSLAHYYLVHLVVPHCPIFICMQPVMRMPSERFLEMCVHCVSFRFLTSQAILKKYFLTVKSRSTKSSRSRSHMYIFINLNFRAIFSAFAFFYIVRSFYQNCWLFGL